MSLSQKRGSSSACQTAGNSSSSSSNDSNHCTNNKQAHSDRFRHDVNRKRKQGTTSTIRVASGNSMSSSAKSDTDDESNGSLFDLPLSRRKLRSQQKVVVLQDTDESSVEILQATTTTTAHRPWQDVAQHMSSAGHRLPEGTSKSARCTKDVMDFINEKDHDHSLLRSPAFNNDTTDDTCSSVDTAELTRRIRGLPKSQQPHNKQESKDNDTVDNDMGINPNYKINVNLQQQIDTEVTFVLPPMLDSSSSDNSSNSSTDNASNDDRSDVDDDIFNEDERRNAQNQRKHQHQHQKTTPGEISQPAVTQSSAKPNAQNPSKNDTQLSSTAASPCAFRLSRVPFGRSSSSNQKSIPPLSNKCSRSKHSLTNTTAIASATPTTTIKEKRYQVPVDSVSINQVSSTVYTQSKSQALSPPRASDTQQQSKIDAFGFPVGNEVEWIDLSQGNNSDNHSIGALNAKPVVTIRYGLRTEPQRKNLWCPPSLTTNSTTNADRLVSNINESDDDIVESEEDIDDIASNTFGFGRSAAKQLQQTRRTIKSIPSINDRKTSYTSSSILSPSRASTTEISNNQLNHSVVYSPGKSRNLPQDLISTGNYDPLKEAFPLDDPSPPERQVCYHRQAQQHQDNHHSTYFSAIPFTNQINAGIWTQEGDCTPMYASAASAETIRNTVLIDPPQYRLDSPVQHNLLPQLHSHEMATSTTSCHNVSSSVVSTTGKIDGCERPRRIRDANARPRLLSTRTRLLPNPIWSSVHRTAITTHPTTTTTANDKTPPHIATTMVTTNKNDSHHWDATNWTTRMSLPLPPPPPMQKDLKGGAMSVASFTAVHYSENTRITGTTHQHNKKNITTQRRRFPTSKGSFRGRGKKKRGGGRGRGRLAPVYFNSNWDGNMDDPNLEHVGGAETNF